MIIKLLSKQIPNFWEAIKFGSSRADEVEEKNLQASLNELLHALLSDKAQCFVALNDSRMLVGLLITRVQINKVTEEKYLLLQSLYMWERMDNSEWQKAFELYQQFAKKEHCKYISYNSASEAVWRKTEQFNFKEKSRTFELKIV